MAIVKTINVAITATTEKFEAGMTTVSKEARQFDAAGAMLDRRMQAIVKQFTHSQITADQFSSKVQELDRELNAVANGFTSMAKAQERANSVIASMRGPLDAYNAKVKELDSLRKLGTLTEQQYRNALAATHNEYHKGTSTITAASKTLAASSRNAGSLTNSLTALSATVPGLSGVSSQLSTIAMVGAPIGIAAAAISGLALGIGSAISEADRVKDISTEIGGDPTELLALEHAARSTGVSIDQLQTGLQKMTVNASAAVNGSKEMQAVFKSLNVDARAITDSTPTQAFSILADAFVAVENPAERARLAVKLFGKGNIELLDTLMEGSKGLASYREESIQFGNVVTPEAARIADAWEKSSGKIILAFKSSALAMLDIFGPAIEFTMKAMEKLATTAGFLGKIVTGDAFGAAQIAGWEKSTVAASENATAQHTAAAAIKTTSEAQAELNRTNEAASAAAAKAESDRWAGVLAAENKTLEKLRMDLTPKIDPTPLELYLSRVKDINEMFDRGKVVLEERNKLLWSAAEIAKKPTEAAEKEMAARRKAMEGVLADRRSVAKRAQDKLAELRMPQVAGPAPPVAALDRGSQAAFAAFKENQQAGKTADLQLLELRKQIRLLEKIAKSGIVLAGAGI